MDEEAKACEYYSIIIGLWRERPSTIQEKDFFSSKIHLCNLSISKEGRHEKQKKRDYNTYKRSHEEEKVLLLIPDTFTFPLFSSLRRPHMGPSPEYIDVPRDVKTTNIFSYISKHGQMKKKGTARTTDQEENC